MLLATYVCGVEYGLPCQAGKANGRDPAGKARTSFTYVCGVEYGVEP